MELQGIVPSGIRQRQETNTCDLPHRWSLRNKTNEETQQKQTHRYREQSDGCLRGGTVGNV